MFLLSPQTKVFLAKDATDMRKSFCGLIVLAEAVLHQDAASGHLFVFVNKRRDMLKILHWMAAAGGSGIANSNAARFNCRNQRRLMRVGSN